MALRMSPVSRNLHAKVTLLGLELEDMLFLAMACAIAMLVGQFLFSDRYMFILPMNWFLMLMVLVLGVPGLMLFKYGKPAGTAAMVAAEARTAELASIAMQHKLLAYQLREAAIQLGHRGSILKQSTSNTQNLNQQLLNHLGGGQ